MLARTTVNTRLAFFDWSNPVSGKSYSFTFNAVYLGILMEYGIYIIKIYQAAYDNFVERADYLSCALSLTFPPGYVQVQIASGNLFAASL